MSAEVWIRLSELHQEPREVRLVDGAILGRGPSATLEFHDNAVSEAHAVLLLRRQGFILRGACGHLFEPAPDATRDPGSRRVHPNSRRGVLVTPGTRVCLDGNGHTVLDVLHVVRPQRARRRMGAWVPLDPRLRYSFQDDTIEALPEAPAPEVPFLAYNVAIDCWLVYPASPAGSPLPRTNPSPDRHGVHIENAENSRTTVIEPPVHIALRKSSFHVNGVAFQSSRPFVQVLLWSGPDADDEFNQGKDALWQAVSHYGHTSLANSSQAATRVHDEFHEFLRSIRVTRPLLDTSQRGRAILRVRPSDVYDITWVAALHQRRVYLGTHLIADTAPGQHVGSPSNILDALLGEHGLRRTKVYDQERVALVEDLIVHARSK